MHPSGPAWCAQFPASSSLGDLAPSFRPGVAAFIDALRNAGASVTINETLRPAERAWLMHWCCIVAGYRDSQHVFHQIAPGEVPVNPAIAIDWTCGGDMGAARAAAVAMRQTYDIAFPAALDSNHVKGLAIDMTIQFKGGISVRDARGIYHQAACLSDLYPIGATYKVFKLATDRPHWSWNGK